MNDTKSDTEVAQNENEKLAFTPEVIAAMESVPTDGEPEPMTQEEFLERMKDMVTRVADISQIERDVVNVHEQRITVGRRFADAMKRGDQQEASQHLIRWCQLAGNLERHHNRLLAKVAEVLAEVEG